MDGILKKNIEALTSGSPASAESAARLTAAGIFDAAGKITDLVLAYIPPFDMEHAQSWACSTGDFCKLAFLGFGSGDRLLAAWRTSASRRQHLYVFEIYLELLYWVLSENDLSEMLSAPNFHLFFGQDTLSPFVQNLAQLYPEWLDDIRTAFRGTSRSFVSLLTTKDGDLTYKNAEKLILPYVDRSNQTFDYAMKIMPSAEELSDFLGVSIRDIVATMYNAPETLAASWHQASPSTPEEIHKWYCETDGYLYELCLYHALSPSYPPMSQAVIDWCRAIGGRTLDFGGGNGDISIRLAQSGHDIEYCDVPGKTLDFAAWRFARRSLSIPVHKSTNPLSPHIDGTYNIIIALDVLEHLPDPIHFCEIFFQHIQPGGFLIAKPSFTTDDTHPMHLASNAHFTHSFDQELARIGYILHPSSTSATGFWLRP